tara:strand:+ start:524 stop:754 length:231 start_codon:yes stop_codon:yes gene_type:complete
MNCSLEHLLVLRSQWEEIVKRYRIPEKDGTLDTLRWFVKNGRSSNRFRKRCDEAIKLAHTILEEYDNGFSQETTTG